MNDYGNLVKHTQPANETSVLQADTKLRKHPT